MQPQLLLCIDKLHWSSKTMKGSMAEPPRQSKHMSKHSQESQPCTRFPLGIFLRWRTRISSDHTALALSALENHPLTKACRSWVMRRQLEVFPPGHRKHCYERILRQSQLQKHQCRLRISGNTLALAVNQHRQLSTEGSVTVSKSTLCLATVIYLFLLTADSTPSQAVPIQSYRRGKAPKQEIKEVP